ncbi:glutaredoxin family protein [Paenibacillus dendritiformis]|uniref:Glutaredoxin n=1 Tax=Paenibacillus dendritiformis C454 TaxID=1131935 RepID=H3SJG1_9BACL|nr:glutaredoxin family protein [Paenibacillus dendritiformis]EHQ60803.1 glutaredoxin [Paenibacillus dendritiformis C454]PZM61904.1 glutaredoxin family protein [Paenibacillus dendritiformis]CAH8770296.1 glutaredoxin family protein [Paenibacillus dendritiformis]
MDEKVIVYTSTYCQYCSQVKKFLGERNVEFEERNIDKDEKYAEELWNTGMRSVPVTLIGETQILGFNQIQLNQALAARA